MMLSFVSLIQFFVYGFWSPCDKVTKILPNLCYILQGKMGKTEKTQKENNATKVTKIH